MNQAKFDDYRTGAHFSEHKRYVDMQAIHIESDYYFIQPSQVIDVAKERDT